MAPPNASGLGRGQAARTLAAVTEFAADLGPRLKDARDDSSLDDLLADVNHHIQTMMGLADVDLQVQSVASGTQGRADGRGRGRPRTQGASRAPAGGIDRRQAKNVEARGKDLWNTIVRVKRDGDVATMPRARRRLLLRARMLAFQMLEAGRAARRRRRADDEIDALYLINLAVALGRNCLAGESKEADLEAARFVLQKMAGYVDRLKAVPGAGVDSEGETARRKFEAEYLAMRTALSWREGRLDVAEHMFREGDALRHMLDVPSAEIVADTLQHIGADLAGKGDHTMAIKWLRRAYEILNHQPLDRLSAHGLELRLAVCQTLFKSLLDEGTPPSVHEAGDLVAFLETELGDLPVVLHWRLELLQKAPGEVFDVDAYVSLLRRLIRSFDFSDGTFHFLLHHVRGLKEKSARLACCLLDELLQRHVLQSNKKEWLNKIVVWRVWISCAEEVRPGETDGAPADIKRLLDSVRDNHPGPLMPDIAAAVHSLLWKRIQALFVGGNHSIVEAWCLVALHEVLSSSGDAHLGVFHRRLILCAIALHDAEKARATFRSMPESSQNHMLSRYLMFKVSLLSWDHELGRECIEQIARTSGKSKNQSRDYLYSCIQEAQQAGDKLCALTALRCIAESWDAGESRGEGGNLPAVLRCAIHLITSISEEEHLEGADDSGLGMVARKDTFPEDLCRMMETAAQHAKATCSNGNRDRTFSVKELNWFRKTAYNTGVKYLETWELALLTRIFTACLVFHDCYPQDMPLADVSERSLMSMRCHFVIATALVASARTSDEVDEQRRWYLEARRHVGKFDGLLQTEADAQEGPVIGDLVAKLSTLSVFDFEAATHLQSWDQLNEIVRRAKICRDENMYKAMGDCMLRSKAPGRILFATMRLIISEIYELERFDSAKMAKYIRCVFQAILPLDDVAALQLLDQALSIAKAARESGQSLPDTEIEWLAAVSFNHGIELYSRGEEEACHRWALKAMALAERVDDGGALRSGLQTNFARLRFDGPDRRMW